MGIEKIYLGQRPDDSTGDWVREGGRKVNALIDYVLESGLKPFVAGELLSPDKAPFHRVYQGNLYRYVGAVPNTLKASDIPGDSVVWVKVSDWYAEKKAVEAHQNNSSIHVTQQEKEDWSERYSLDFNTATNEIILFKGDKEISKAKIELLESIPWTDLTLSSGARASRAKYKINMRTVMFDVYNLEIPKTRPFTIFNMPEHLRPEKDRYIGGVVRLTTYETYSLIVKRNGNVMINFPMEKLRNDRFSFTVEYTLD